MSGFLERILGPTRRRVSLEVIDPCRRSRGRGRGLTLPKRRSSPAIKSEHNSQLPMQKGLNLDVVGAEIRSCMLCCLAALAGLAENEAAQGTTQRATDRDRTATADRAQRFPDGFLAVSGRVFSQWRLTDSHAHSQNGFQKRALGVGVIDGQLQPVVQAANPHFQPADQLGGTV